MTDFDHFRYLNSDVYALCSISSDNGLKCRVKARLAQSVERLTLNQVVGGSSPPVGVTFLFFPRNFLFGALLLY